jgi:hypothetical protein
VPAIQCSVYNIEPQRITKRANEQLSETGLQPVSQSLLSSCY